jgi:hypothetical protein
MAHWSTHTRTHRGLLPGILALVLLGACIPIPIPFPISGSASGTSSSHVVRLKLPPLEAARCFARNAEEHSSALAAEARADRDGAETIVRVKNGVTYATGQFRPSGNGSRGEIELMVRTSGSQSDLLDALLQGC